ncbi:MAG: VOC family protein [Armatimonadetes bacterium]|nr:VOC family protein [Armatimonadota bacterium]
MLKLDAIGIVVQDIDRSLRFYRLLGVPVPDSAEGEDHVEATLPCGIRLMWDTVELMKEVGHWEEPVGHRMGLAFDCGNVAGVDSTFAAVVAAGFVGKAEPWDAFWGQRYAQLTDPDGNTVDLFAPLSSE